MPRTPVQGLTFLLGFALSIWMSPFVIHAARADGEAPWAALEATFHDAVNAERRARNLLPLERDAALDAVARAHSTDMAVRGYLAHVDPEGMNPLQRIQAAGISGFTLAAENAGQTDEADPVRRILGGWIGSPIHRNNLHAPAFNRAGVGIARSEAGIWYVTQLYVTVPQEEAP